MKPIHPLVRTMLALLAVLALSGVGAAFATQTAQQSTPSASAKTYGCPPGTGHGDDDDDGHHGGYVTRTVVGGSTTSKTGSGGGHGDDDDDGGHHDDCPPPPCPTHGDDDDDGHGGYYGKTGGGYGDDDCDPCPKSSFSSKTGGHDDDCDPCDNRSLSSKTGGGHDDDCDPCDNRSLSSKTYGGHDDDCDPCDNRSLSSKTGGGSSTPCDPCKSSAKSSKTGGSSTPTCKAPTASCGSASSITATTASVVGTVNPGGAATTVWFEYGTSTAYGSKTSEQSAGNGTTAKSVSAALSGLQPGKKYYVQVVAKNAKGTVKGAGCSFTTKVDKPKCSTGGWSHSSSTSGKLDGSVNPGGGATTGYFEYGKTASLGTKTGSISLGSGTDSVAALSSLASLSKNTKYYYRLVATNSAGTTIGVTSSFTTLADKPTAVTGAASSLTTTGAKLNGSSDPGGAATNAYFEYGKTTGLGSKTANQALGAGDTAVAASASLTGLSKNTKYYFRLVTTNSAGYSVGSTGSFTTGADKPTAVTGSASSIAATTAKLNGTSDPGGAATTSYFEFGKTTSFGTKTTSQSLGSGETAVAAVGSLTGLAKNTKYYFRLVATNSAGSATGATGSFTTAK